VNPTRGPPVARSPSILSSSTDHSLRFPKVVSGAQKATRISSFPLPQDNLAIAFVHHAVRREGSWLLSRRIYPSRWTQWRACRWHTPPRRGTPRTRTLSCARLWWWARWIRTRLTRCTKYRGSCLRGVSVSRASISTPSSHGSSPHCIAVCSPV
jgi:hypothetical protein